MNARSRPFFAKWQSLNDNMGQLCIALGTLNIYQCSKRKPNNFIQTGQWLQKYQLIYIARTFHITRCIFCTSHVISLPLIMNHARAVPIVPYLSRSIAGIWPWEAFGLCSRFEIVMLALGRRQTIFLTPYFKFENILFSFLMMRYMHIIMIFCVLPGIMENSLNCNRKVMEFYYQISVGTVSKGSVSVCSRLTSSAEHILNSAKCCKS